MRRLAGIWIALLALGASVLPAGAAIQDTFHTLVNVDVVAALATSPDGVVYLSTGSARRSGQLYALRSNSEIDDTIYVPAGPTDVVALRGMAFDDAGNLYVADLANSAPGRGRVIRISTRGRQTVFATGLTAPLGVAVDRDGIVYVTNGVDGSIVWIGQDGASAEFVTDERLKPHQRRDYGASGLVMSPEEDALFVTNRADDKVLMLQINRDGSAGRLTTLAEAAQLSSRVRAAGGLAGPDALTIDSRGNLIVAASRGSQVNVLSLDGRYLGRYDINTNGDGDASPTAVTTAGRQLYVGQSATASGGSRIIRISLSSDYD
ncbi:MAG: SMP-30/gluconolactonase/LRE family protein [Chloroflexi bacterium]|nr:SMP-30/gluconolactonase/LRE family protein [Chloroflexota bacterium]